MNDDHASLEDQSDYTGLTIEEQRVEEILYEGKARCRKFDRNAANHWPSKGLGVIRLLRNKETGTTRVMMRQTPNGQVLINHTLLKGSGMNELMGEKNFKMTFAEPNGDLGTYMAGFGEKTSAERWKDAIMKVLC